MARVLVAYASKNGSTAEIAEAVAQELRRHGLDVDCLEAAGVHSLEPYAAVVLGSAVYAKHWRSSARRLLRRHGRELAARPWWMFSSGPVGEPRPLDPEAAAWLEPPKIVRRAESLGVREHVVFGGRVPAEPRNFVERAMVRSTPPQFADRRDWREIARWAAKIAAEVPSGRGLVAAA